MLKNPFVNCKSRKRRKPRVVINQQQPKGYCPRTMVRYDGSPNEYKTAWVCKMCLKFLLSEDACKDHLKGCNPKSFNKPLPTPKSVEDMRYICEYCSKVFSRKVTLKKHMEEHEKSSGPESDDEDGVVFDENQIVVDENETQKDENQIAVEENENTKDENQIEPMTINENEIVSIIVDENKMMIKEINNENKIVVDENKTVVDENKTVVDENKIVIDENMIMVDTICSNDTNEILVSEEIKSTEDIYVDEEQKNVLENLII